jgi:tRNA threonylcarbamoyladenosine biosynthesis protein TsaE
MYRFFQIFSDGELTMEIYLQDSAATEALGKLLGRHAADGDVFCLTGDLGAGKTLLSRGVAEALGVSSEDVTSPTFAIMNVYQGTELEVRHFDLYRLNRPEELEDIGFDEYAGGDGVTLIEWAELFSEQLPEEYLQITLLLDGAGRRAVLEPKGERYEELLGEVEKDADFGN